LLGGGQPAVVVAQAVGVTESMVSQWMSDASFAAEVTELKFHNLQKFNEMDDKYDGMEKKLATQLEEVIPLLMRPMEIAKVLQTVNNMKRRGQSAPEHVTAQSTVVNLLMPKVIVQQFTTNVNNQVIHAGGQTLETIQGSVLLNAAKAKQAEMSKLGLGLHNELKNYTANTEVTSGSGGGGIQQIENAITGTE
jgi:hypothetical protein